MNLELRHGSFRSRPVFLGDAGILSQVASSQAGYAMAAQSVYDTAYKAAYDKAYAAADALHLWPIAVVKAKAEAEAKAAANAAVEDYLRKYAPAPVAPAPPKTVLTVSYLPRELVTVPANTASTATANAMASAAAMAVASDRAASRANPPPPASGDLIVNSIENDAPSATPKASILPILLAAGGALLLLKG